MLPIDLLLGVLCIGVFFLAVTLLQHLFIVVPYIPTPMDTVRAMIAAVDWKGGERVIDLGAGDARLLIEAKKQHPTIIATGYESILLVWLLGLIRIWWSAQEVALKRRNLFTADLSQADVVFLYLFPSLLDRLLPIFDRQLCTGTLVISHAFRFKDREPVQMVTTARGKKIYVYEWKHEQKAHSVEQRATSDEDPPSQSLLASTGYEEIIPTEDRSFCRAESLSVVIPRERSVASALYESALAAK